MREEYAQMFAEGIENLCEKCRDIPPEMAEFVESAEASVVLEYKDDNGRITYLRICASAVPFDAEQEASHE